MIITQGIRTPGNVRIGNTSDQEESTLNQFTEKMLLEENYEIIDFGNYELKNEDDYPDFVIPYPNATANEMVHRIIAVCDREQKMAARINKVNL